MNYFDECKKKYGTVIYNNVEYALMDQAFINNVGTDNGIAYFAFGFSQDQLKKSGNNDIDLLFDEHVSIMWNCYEWWDNNDESDACNWDQPESVEIK